MMQIRHNFSNRFLINNRKYGTWRHFRLNKTFEFFLKHKIVLLCCVFLVFLTITINGQGLKNTYLLYNLDAYCTFDKMEIEDGSTITGFYGSLLYPSLYSNFHLNIYFTVGMGYQIRTMVYPNTSNYTQTININGCTKQMYFGCPIDFSAVKMNNYVGNNLSFQYGAFSPEIPTPKLYYIGGSVCRSLA